MDDFFWPDAACSSTVGCGERICKDMAAEIAMVMSGELNCRL